MSFPRRSAWLECRLLLLPIGGRTEGSCARGTRIQKAGLLPSRELGSSSISSYGGDELSSPLY